MDRENKVSKKIITITKVRKVLRVSLRSF